VVSDDGERRTDVAHSLSDMKNLPLFWSAIDKIANEDYSSIRVTEDSIVIAIVHFPQ
jgi:hypothetical protein